MNFKEELEKRTRETEQIIDQYLPAETQDAAALVHAVNYSMKAGGKRLRPMLIREAYRLFGGDHKVVEPFMAAMEMIHTHSLVHDDLPALDNDQFRRGRETTHMVYGEALAILCGDALLNYAYETAIRGFALSRESERISQALNVLSSKAGMYGMLGGQSVDVMNDKKQRSEVALTIKELDYIYKNKTAALIEASLMIGAILAGASKEEVAVMEQVGYYTGMAFQIQDDILDVTSTTQVLGKPVLSDEKNHKTTYVTLKGLEQARQETKQMTCKALELLEGLSRQNLFLYRLIEFLLNRKK